MDSTIVIIAGTFVLVLGLILGIYWAFVVRPEQQSRDALKQRLTPKSPERKRRLILAQDPGEAQAGSALKLLAALLAPVQRRLNRAGLKMAATPFVILVAWCGILVCATIWIGTGFPLAGLGAGAVALFGPVAFVNFKGRRRAWRFEEQFPEAVDLIARALRAGHAFPTAISMVAGEVPDPVGTEFKKLYEQQNFGMSLPDAMRAFADRVPVLDARFFVTAVLTQRESGG